MNNLMTSAELKLWLDECREKETNKALDDAGIGKGDSAKRNRERFDKQILDYMLVSTNLQTNQRVKD